MNPIDILNILTWAAFFGVGVVPLIIAIQVKNAALRIMSLLLGLFALTHGLYHLSLAYGFIAVAQLVLEPVSVVFLIAFGVYYSKKAAF